MNKHLRHQPSMTKSTTTMDYILVHFGLPHKMNINKTIYFLCVPLGGNVLHVWQMQMRCWSMSPKSSTTDCYRKRLAWGILCRRSNCKTCKIYLYVFFYTYYSVELWIIWNALYFSMSRGIIVTPTSVVHTFSFRTKDGRSSRSPVVLFVHFFLTVQW